MTISIFSKFFFLASIKLSWNRRTYLYSGGTELSIDIHFVDLEVSYVVLYPLPMSKHFNHPHLYVEIATTISDTLFKSLFVTVSCKTDLLADLLL